MRDPVSETPELPRSGTVAAADALWLVVATSLAQLVTLGLGLVLRSELGPVGMGYVSVTQLVTGYASFLSLGAMQAAEREIPIAIARGDENTARSLELAGVAVALVVSVLACAVLLALGASRRATDPLLGAALICAALGLIAQQISIWAIVRLRTRLRFKALAWSTAGAAVAASLLAIAGALVAGPGGALVGVLVASVIQAALLSRVARIGRLALPPSGAFRRLAPLSPAFLASGTVATLLLTVDQLAVGLTLGTTSLGLYSAAYIGYAFVLRIPTLINTVIYPRLQRELGATADVVRVFAMASRAAVSMAIIMPILVGVSFVVLPALVFVILPQFREAVGPMRLLLVGVAGLAFAMPAAHYLVTVDRQRLQVAISGSILAIMSVAYLIAAANGIMSLEVASGVDAAAYICYGIVVHVAARHVAGQPLRLLLRLMPVYLLPMTELLVGAAVVDAMVPRANPTGVLLNAGLQSAFFVLTWAGLAQLYLRDSPESRGDLLVVVDVMRTAVGRIYAAVRRSDAHPSDYPEPRP
jgi:O-antigen/teichoic acid export membrane protein